MVIASIRTREYAVIWWDSNRHRDGICSKSNTKNGYASIGSVQTERNAQAGIVVLRKYAVNLECKCSVARRYVQVLWYTNNRTR